MNAVDHADATIDSASFIANGLHTGWHSRSHRYARSSIFEISVGVAFVRSCPALLSISLNCRVTFGYFCLSKIVAYRGACAPHLLRNNSPGLRASQSARGLHAEQWARNANSAWAYQSKSWNEKTASIKTQKLILSLADPSCAAPNQTHPPCPATAAVGISGRASLRRELLRGAGRIRWAFR